MYGFTLKDRIFFAPPNDYISVDNKRKIKVMKGQENMNNLENLSKQFVTDYEIFINACDAIEEEGKWDIPTYGEMEAYYANDLFCIVTNLVAVDGKISPTETRFVNELLGMRIETAELQTIYENSHSEILTLVENEIQASLTLLKKINSDLANHFKGMLSLACAIVSASDHVIGDTEKALIEKVDMLKV